MKMWIDSLTTTLSFLAIIISLWTYWITRQHLLIERVHKIMDRLYEIDRIILEFPKVQSTLYTEANRRDLYFVSSNEHNDLYFQVKSFVYMQLNIADEILSIVGNDKGLQQKLEFEDWKGYIIKKMRHPLFRELFDRESSIWGDNFRKFISNHRSQILEPVDPEMS